MAHTGLTEEQLSEEYIGPRDESFDQLILSILGRGKLSKKLVDIVFDKELFSKVFTHKSIDEENNYEYYEFIGDLTINKIIGIYLTRRFPQLRCTAGVRVLTRLKINLVSKKVLAVWAESLGFWPFISATREFRETKKKPMMEDVLEAIMGLLEQQIDEKCCKPGKNGQFTSGGGFRICYNILKSVLDTFPICGGLPDEFGVQTKPLKYTELVDPKTRLKELFDKHRDALGKVKYTSERDGQLCHSEVYADMSQVQGARRSRWNMGRGTAALQADSRQAASEQALAFLKQRGYTRAIPDYYARFCE